MIIIDLVFYYYEFLPAYRQLLKDLENYDLTEAPIEIQQSALYLHQQAQLVYWHKHEARP